MEYDYLDFNFNDLPEVFDYTIDGNQYRFRLYYNDLDDSFHIDIWDQYDNPLVMGEKLVYGEPLWGSINDPRLPLVDLLPLDDDRQQSTVTALNFPSVVKLEFCTDDPFNQNNNSDQDSDDTDDYDQTNDNTRPSQITGNDYGNDPTVGDNS